MGVERHVDSVHLDDAISITQSCRSSRRPFVHLADELTRLAALRVQVEPVAAEVRHLADETETRRRSVRWNRRHVREYLPQTWMHAYHNGEGRKLESFLKLAVKIS